MASSAVMSCCGTCFVKKVHFSYYFLGDTMPKDTQEAIQKVIDDNPDWVVTVWNPQKSLELMQSPPYSTFLETYSKFPYAIQRSDMSRYAILHKHGGLYMDVDYVLKRPLNDIMQYLGKMYPTGTAFVNESPNTIIVQALSNSFMIAKVSGHPFWMHVLQLCKPALPGEPRTVINSAGPGTVTRAYRTAPKLVKKTVIPLPTKNFNPCSVCDRGTKCANGKNVFAVHTSAGSWHSSSDKHTNILDSMMCNWKAITVGFFITVALVVAIALAAMYGTKASRCRISKMRLKQACTSAT